MLSRILVVVILLAGCYAFFAWQTAFHGRSQIVPAAATSPAPSAGPLILFLGDSLSHGIGLAATQAFPALVEQRLRKEGFPHRVLSVAVSGMTSAGGLERIDFILQEQPRYLILALGGNDGLRALPLEATRANLKTIIEKAQRAHTTVILAGMRVPPNYGDDYVKGFQSLFPSLAAEYHLPLIPFLLEGVGGIPSLNQEDGIHPNAAGQQKIADTVWGVLSKTLSSPPGPTAMVRDDQKANR